jgi:uncharacterized protein YbbC (DUF1343 family)
MRFFTTLLLLLVTFPAFATPPTPVKTGAQMLHDRGYDLLRGKRVGVITNHTAMVGDRHLIDLMHGSGAVRLTALFGPEHGLRGLAEDGVPVREGIDERTKVPVHSLYGKTTKPTPAMLADVDVLVFDIQDIGARFYTYISTLGLSMQAAAATGKTFVVLDRPNPLGGNYIAGFVREPSLASFVARYPIPVTHGMTVAELALMIKGEGLLPGLANLDLRIVRMEGWQRDMQWPATGLPWIRTSPNIPDFTTALLYPGLCFLEATSISEGRGTREPFQVTGVPRLDAERLATRLNAAKLPGIRFEPVDYTPRSLPGISSTPKFKDRKVSGVRLIVTDPSAFKPVETGIHLLAAYYDIMDKPGQASFFQPGGFDRLAGTARLRQAIRVRTSPEAIISSWQGEVEHFREQRRKYLIY